MFGAFWLSYLPDWSPLIIEQETYETAQQRGLDTPELKERLAELEENPKPGHTLLGKANPRLRAHSYFGPNLGSRETLCAVGSAMQSARIMANQQGSPDWAQFDLRRILKSYFDGLIHACVLRWCESQECWWGPNSSDCSDYLLELEALDFDFTLLLPELLLACAQEKLPIDATAQLVQTAKTRLDGDSLDKRSRDHLRLGINICNQILN